MQSLRALGFSVDQSRHFVGQLAEQVTAVSTVQMFAMCAVIFVGAATIAWLP